MMKKFFAQLMNELRGQDTGESSAYSRSHTLELAATVILLETAAMDDEIAPEEREKITGILRSHFQLSGTAIKELLDSADEARDRAVDLHQFTQVINEQWSREQKNRLMTFIWEIIYADGRLDQHEDYLAHKLARLLHVDHKEFVSAKLEAREKAARSRLLENDRPDRASDAETGGRSG